MESIDSKVFALIALATLTFVGLLKTILPKRIKGNEAVLSVVLPILFTVIAKAAGWFVDTSWVDALMWAFGAGVASGVVHDKVVNPAKIMPKNVKNLLSRKPKG